MIGMPAFLSGAFFLSSGSTPQIPSETLMPRLPPSFIAFAWCWSRSHLVCLVQDTFGLRLRSVGENPEAADAAGVRVARMRYAGVLLSGVLAGVGGAYISIGQSSLFTRNITAGRGFIALGGPDLRQVATGPDLLACLLFGFTEAMTYSNAGGGETAFKTSPFSSFRWCLTAHHYRLGRIHWTLSAPRALGIPTRKER